MSVVPMIGGRVSQRTSPCSSLIRIGTTLAVSLFEAAARAIQIRRDMRRLSEFDDYMLRDLGITRADIEGVVRRGYDALENEK